MAKDKEKTKVKKNKKIKVASSVEKNMVQITNTIVNIYNIKLKELALKTEKVDNNTQQVRENLFNIQAEIREVLNTCHYDIKALYENTEYEGRRTKTNYLEEFINKEQKVLRRYAYFDIERILREDYYDCKNAPVRKGIRAMMKAKKKYIKLSNTYTKKTHMKKLLVN